MEVGQEVTDRGFADFSLGYKFDAGTVRIMPSEAQHFEADFEKMKEYIDADGCHYCVIQFSDDSGRIFRKKRSVDGKSTAEFVSHDDSAMECMRRIASGSAFEVDENTNTQQNLRNLLR